MPSQGRYGARRNFQIRPVRAVITIVCDDTKAAVKYFELFRREFMDQKTIRVYSAPHHGATGSQVVQCAIEKKPDTTEADDRTVVLIDVDSNPDQQVLANAGGEGGVQVLFSKPCFEVWTLAHIEDTGAAFQDCAAVLQRIKAKWKTAFGQDFGNKSDADYSKIRPHSQAAIERCRKRKASNSHSWTEVWQVVEAIIKP